MTPERAQLIDRLMVQELMVRMYQRLNQWTAEQRLRERIAQTYRDLAALEAR